MSSKSNIDDFLDVIKQDFVAAQAVTVNGKEIDLMPLNFKQQKALVTTGLDGLVGVISFIHALNSTILTCSSETDLKITDRVPLTLHLRRLFTQLPVESDGKHVHIDELIEGIKDYNDWETAEVGSSLFTINLEIPSLVKENKYLLECIKELKTIQEEGLGDNISTILAYEIPKFITNIEFGEKIINFDSLNIKEKLRIVNGLPASITKEISDYISKISQYDEALLTVGDTTVELDSSFFE